VKSHELISFVGHGIQVRRILVSQKHADILWQTLQEQKKKKNVNRSLP
jgi:hypothetical protein